MRFNFNHIILAIFLCIFCMTSSQGIAQKVKISPEINLRNDDYFEIIGKIDDRILIMRERTGKVQIDIYRNDLTYNKAVPLEFEQKTINLIGSLKKDSTFSIFYAFRDKEAWKIRIGQYNQYIELVDTATILSFDRQINDPYFAFDKSEDKSKVLVFYTEDDLSMEAMVFDVTRLKPLWYKKFEFETSIQNTYEKALVTDEGNLFIIGEKTDRKIGKDDYSLDLMSFDWRHDQVSFHQYELKNLSNYDFEIRYDNQNDNLICAGMFGDKNGQRANGVYYLSIDGKNPKSHTFNHLTFDPDIYREVYGADAQKRKGITDISSKEIVLRQDGGFLYISEIEKVYERRPSYGTRNYARDLADGRWVDYYHEDLIIYSIHPDGKLHWFDVLQKKQFSQDDYAVYSSYFLFKSPSHLRLLYNDEIKNNSTVSEYIVTASGETDRNAVMSTDYQKIRLRFQDAVQISGKQLIVPSDRSSKFNLVMIEF